MPFKHISLANLEMTNFKRFYGRHSIDLSSQPDSGKPLVLIGGDNGRGKTSIHEAISYALYEDDDLPGVHTRPNYLRAVSDRLNRKALDEGQTEYEVAVELLIGNGAGRRLRIERRWEVDVAQRQATRPLLRIYENERPIDWIEDNPGAYQDFLRSLIPPRIAPFFFFDGERIQEFADDDNHEHRMIEAIEDILHISVYKALRDDLKKFVIDPVSREEASASANDDFYELQADKERIERELEQKEDRVGDIEREIEDLSREQRRGEDELRRIASPHASQREELLAESSRLNLELEAAKNEIQSGFEHLPVLLTGKLRLNLVSTLESEQQSLATPERIEKLRTQLYNLKQKIFESPQPPVPANALLSPEQMIVYCSRFDYACSQVFGLDKGGVTGFLHDIGDTGRQRIIDRIAIVEQVGANLREALNRRERLTNDLREVDIKLQSTSDDPYVEELLKRSKGINMQMGKLQEELRTLEGEMQRLKSDLAKRSRQIEDRIERRKSATKGKAAVKVAREARKALDEFIKRLAVEKLTVLRDYMDDMYGRLRKPEDAVKHVDVDPETWQVVLKDEMNRPLEKRVFSAGMREMYALSLLWALSKASARELPIVIDTPVGRLDTTNRRALFEKYLPYAGHQVVVLSTDTEVDVDWVRRLEPYIARQYCLDYDSSVDSARIRLGYFF